MSNIDKQDRQVQRFANYGVDMMEWVDGGYVKHSDYLALLDELEAKDRRIAEMEAREVKLPERYEVEMCPTPSPDGDWYSRDDVLAALATAGLKVAAAGKGE